MYVLADKHKYDLRCFICLEDINMKRVIKYETNTTQLDIFSLDIKSIVFVDDAEAYRPKNNYVYDVYASHNTNYSALSREQLLQLDEKERSKIHDIDALRNLHFDELTIQQQREVTQANMDYTFRLTKSEFDAIIKKLTILQVFTLFLEQKMTISVDSLKIKEAALLVMMY